MKKTLLLILSIVSAVICQAQIQIKDSTVNVVAYFNKGDTVIYEYTHMNPKYIGKDTLYDVYLVSKFQLSVLSASDDKGYRLEYTPINCTYAPDSLLTETGKLGVKMAKAIERIAFKMKPIFVMDEYGSLKKIENSKEIMSKWKKAVDIAVKTMYDEEPNLEKLIKKKAMKESMLAVANTEADLWKLYEEVILLFAYHGQAFGMKDTTVTNVTGSTYVYSGKDQPDEYGTDEDYVVFAKQTTNIPSETVKSFVGEKLEQLVGKDMIDSLNSIVAKSDGWPDLEMTNTHIIRYWFNGWPKETTTVKKVRPTNYMKEEDAKAREIRFIEWTNRRFQ
ncbi:MAG: hypothetical protein K6G31_06055 [Paludibacteraceae bacterium]|nr:hypothetical protein [Paludibacteraceae bacterium]